MKKLQAFTLVEIMIVVAIIALLAAVALPSLLNARRKSRIARMSNDFRVISGSFEQYAMENSKFPPDGPGPGIVPSGMATFFTKIRFTDQTPFGGQWDWDVAFTYPAGVSVVGSPFDAQEWLALDERMDDGNLSTGALRTGSGRYTYILQE